MELGSIPGQGTKILQAVCHSQKKRNNHFVRNFALGLFQFHDFKGKLHGVGSWPEVLDSSVVSIDAFH